MTDATLTTQGRLLIVDDDMKFCRLISGYLSGFGYEVTAIHNGSDALKAVESGKWQAIILDVMLPGMDGFKVLQLLREHSDTPVLMLTALGEEADRIVGLELGADDYVAKTSSPRELLARLRAVLRRVSRANDGSDNTVAELAIGHLRINFDAHTVTLDGEPIILTPVEFDLLAVLAQSRGRVKSREELINAIRDRDYDVFDRSVDVHVSALRKKLRDDKKNPRFIRTVRAAGYMLISPRESAK